MRLRPPYAGNRRRVWRAWQSHLSQTMVALTLSLRWPLMVGRVLQPHQEKASLAKTPPMSDASLYTIEGKEIS